MNWSQGASFILGYDHQMDGTMNIKQSNSLLKVNVDFINHCRSNGELPIFIEVWSIVDSLISRIAVKSWLLVTQLGQLNACLLMYQYQQVIMSFY